MEALITFLGLLIGLVLFAAYLANRDSKNGARYEDVDWKKGTGTSEPDSDDTLI